MAPRDAGTRVENLQAQSSMRRRGMIAAAAALIVGLTAQEAGSTRVAAGVDGDVVLGASNTTTGTTIISDTYGTITGGGSGYELGTAFIANGTDATIGVRGYCLGAGTGVSGRTDIGSGVNGVSLGTSGQVGGIGVTGGAYNGGGIGVHGFALDTSAGIGVYGENGHVGVSGKGSYLGVFGDATTTGQFGVYGLAGASFGAGVLGVSQSGTSNPNGKGVAAYGYGTNNTGLAAYGTAIGVDAQTSGAGTAINAGAQNGPAINAGSSGSHGIYSTTAAKYFAGVYGYTATPGAIGVYGVAGNAGAYAGAFSGTTIVVGPFMVYTGPKSAAVPHPDGSYRLLYCVESPESWFEDFGEGTLVAGKAEVKLDADFAAVVDTSAMHVFFTETGGNHALALTGKSATGFTVMADTEALTARGKKASDVSGTFSYRVVAKRKDLQAARLAKVPPPPPVPKPLAVAYTGEPALPKTPAPGPSFPPLPAREKKG